MIGGDRELTGFTKTIYWYAPQFGRAVLRAQAQAGRVAYLAGDMLASRHAQVVELASYREQAKSLRSAPPKLAHAVRASYPGWTPVFNDTWQYRLTNQMHTPRIEDR